MNFKEEIEKLDSEMETIGKRAAEIQGELADADEARTAELREELEQLDARSKAIPSEKEDLAKKREEEAARLFKEAKEQEEKQRSSKMNIEEITKLGEALMRGERVAIKTRDILISSSGITNPAKTENEVRPGFYSSYSVLDHLDVVDAKGNTSWIVPIEGADPTAANGTDGQLANNSDPAFKKATLTAQPINVVTYVSKHIASYTPTDYYNKVSEKVFRAVRKAALNYVVGKLTTGAADDSTALYEDKSLTITAFDQDFLRKMLLAYGGDETIEGEAVLLLCKDTLSALGAVRGTNEKQAVYHIQYDEGVTDSGIISEGGLAVRFYIVSALKGQAKNTAIVFKPKAFTLAQFEEVQVSVSRDEKFSQGLLSILAECSIGGNINCLKGSEFVEL